MPELPEAIFLEGVHLAVARNGDLVPPHQANATNGSMYIRPMMFGSGPNLILASPDEVSLFWPDFGARFRCSALAAVARCGRPPIAVALADPLFTPQFTFIVYVTPTGSLYGAAGTQAPAIDALVLDNFDRAAPKGVGHAKLAGNYAPVFKHAAAAKKAGYAITLHLDSASHLYVDEFSTSNALFLKNSTDASQPKTLVVPTSESILKSVTTKSIIEIAEDFGWAIERRAVPFKEIQDGLFDEVAACGTAAAVRRPSSASLGSS